MKGLLFSLLLWSCTKSDPQTPVTPARTPTAEPVSVSDISPLAQKMMQDGYLSVWNDEFSGAGLNPAKWEYRQTGVLRTLGRVDKNMVQVNGKGNLTIQLQQVDGEYKIGQIGTEKLFKVKYGYFECRAKMNQQLGPHVAFWLQSSTLGKYLNDPVRSGDEVDIFEYHRKEPTVLHHNLHWDGYGADHKTTGQKVLKPGIGTGYHTFGLLWTEKEYVFYMDNEETWRTTTAVSNVEEYLLLSLELTGWGGDPAKATLPDEVAFDYVRVYQKK